MQTSTSTRSSIYLQLAQFASSLRLDAASPSNLELPEAAEKADFKSLVSIPEAAAQNAAGSGAASVVRALLLLM
jgi:hypothetical protein